MPRKLKVLILTILVMSSAIYGGLILYKKNQTSPELPKFRNPKEAFTEIFNNVNTPEKLKSADSRSLRSEVEKTIPDLNDQKKFYTLLGRLTECTILLNQDVLNAFDKKAEGFSEESKSCLEENGKLIGREKLIDQRQQAIFTQLIRNAQNGKTRFSLDREREIVLDRNAIEETQVFENAKKEWLRTNFPAK